MSAFTLERQTQPSVEPVTLAEMKRHLRMYEDITDEDDDVTALITTARQWVEGYTGRVLVDQSWLQTELAYVEGEVLIKRSPVIVVSSVGLVGDDGVETTVDSGYYSLVESNSKFPRLVPITAWGAGDLRIRFRAGYADRTGSPTQGVDVVPNTFKQAMKLYCQGLYDRSDSMKALIEAAEYVLSDEKAALGIA